MGDVRAQAGVVREDRSRAHFDERVRPAALEAAFVALQTQIHRPRAFKRPIRPFAQMPKAVGVMGRDGIIGAEQRSGSTDPEVSAANEYL